MKQRGHRHAWSGSGCELALHTRGNVCSDFAASALGGSPRSCPMQKPRPSDEEPAAATTSRDRGARRSDFPAAAPNGTGADPLRRPWENNGIAGTSQTPSARAAAPAAGPTTSSTDASSASSAQTAATIGMSTPSASAARFSTGAVKAPSATVLRSASRSAGARAFADALAEAEIARAWSRSR